MTLTGGLIAKKLGLIDFDMKKIFAWTEELVAFNRGMETNMDSSIEDTLNDYINEHWGNILMIKSTDDLRKDNGNGLDQLVLPTEKPRGQLIARYEPDTKLLFLRIKPFKDWCTDQQINYASLVDDLKEKKGAKRIKKRLTKGTDFNMPAQDVLQMRFEGFDEVTDGSEGDET